MRSKTCRYLAIVDVVEVDDPARRPDIPTDRSELEACASWGTGAKSAGELLPLLTCPFPALEGFCPIQRKHDRIKRGGRADVETVALHATEHHIRHCFGHEDLSKKGSVRIVAMHSVACACPDSPRLIEAHSVEQPCSQGGEDLAAGQATVIGNVEHPNVPRTILDVGCARIRHIESPLIRRKRDSVRAHEVICNDLDFTAVWID